jgi:mannose-6-phosphate isomerase-like protein (cupin superfamily)
MYYYPYLCPYCETVMRSHPYYHQTMAYPQMQSSRKTLEDHGKKPYVININNATKQNNTYRTAIWTGDHLQVTLMSINVGDDIGLEVHPNIDQFLRIEQGKGIVEMGKTKDNLTFVQQVSNDDAIMVPAGTWHNIKNTGRNPLKLYSVYGPPDHPFGTVQQTKAEAMASSD